MEENVAPPPVSPAPSPPPRRMGASQPRTHTVVAVTVAVLAIVGLVANFVLPWATIDFSKESIFARQTSAAPRPCAEPVPCDRDGLLTIFDGQAYVYFQRLVEWPVYAYGLVLLVAALVLVLELVPRILRSPPKKWDAALPPLRLVLFTILGYAGFLLALTGSRWLGVERAAAPLVPRLDDTEPYIDLGPVPYLNLGAGLLLLALATWRLRHVLKIMLARPDKGVLGPAVHRFPTVTLAVAVVGLLLLPLLPYANLPLPSGGKIYFGEGEMDFLRHIPSAAEAKTAANDLSLARGMLWIALYASALTHAATLLERGGYLRRPRLTVGAIHSITLASALVGVLATVRFYVDLPKVPEAEPETNPFLPLTYLALVFAAGLFSGLIALKHRATAAPALEPAAQNRIPAVWNPTQPAAAGEEWALEHRVRGASSREAELRLIDGFKQALAGMQPPEHWRRREEGPIRGRKEEFSWQSLVLVLLLKARYGLTYRDMSNLLKETPELLQRLDLPRAPSHGIIQQTANKIPEDWLVELDKRLRNVPEAPTVGPAPTA